MANTVEDPADERDPVGADPHRTWLERLALLLVVAAVGQVARYALQGLAYAKAFGQDGLGGGEFEWSQFLGVLSVAGDVGVGLLLVIALALVVLAPGRPGRLAVVVANAVSVVGVIVATLAVVAIEEVFRAESSPYNPFGEADRSAERLNQGAVVAGYLPALALALGTAYAAWRLLNAGFGLPGAARGPFAATDGRLPDDRFPDGPLGDETGTDADDDAWAPPPTDRP